MIFLVIIIFSVIQTFDGFYVPYNLKKVFLAERLMQTETIDLGIKEYLTISKQILWNIESSVSIAKENTQEAQTPTWLPSTESWKTLESSEFEKEIKLVGAEKKYSDDLINTVGLWKNSLSEANKNEIPNQKRSSSEESFKRPPTLRDFVSSTFLLDDHHTHIVQQLWLPIKRRHGSMRNLTIEDEAQMIDALKISYVGLWGKRTQRSLEQSIDRARGMAGVLAELNASNTIVLASILYEVVAEIKESGNASLRTLLISKFGMGVITLCDYYIDLPRFMARKTEYTPIQSENQLQMLVVMAKDYRVFYMRLADRLHTLRHLFILPIDKQDKLKIAQEALNIYAPLAHRMGLIKVRDELEDLSFRHLDPEKFHDSLKQKLAANIAYQEAMERLNEISNDVILADNKATIMKQHRIKGKYQMFMKMKRKGLSSLAEVRDALGLRIIIKYPKLANESKEEYEVRGINLCYYVVGRLRNMQGWVPAKQGFKDYIVQKKENSYQSLHQYIVNSRLNTTVELQVRTQEMHMTAELGEAAHWFYKDLIYRPDIANSKVYRQAWRSPQQLKAKTPQELLGMAKNQLTESRIFAYLEDKSNVINMKKGSTLLDAAFAVHTDVGLRTSEVHVNGQPCPLHQQLQNGDVISVKCIDVKKATESDEAPVPSKYRTVRNELSTFDGNSSPSPFWFEVLVSTNAQIALRKYFRDNQRSWLICHGLAQFLMTLTINNESIRKKFNGLPTPAKLIQMAKDRTNLSLPDILFLLGTTPRSHVQFVVGQWLDISPKQLSTTSVSIAVLWARMQGKEGSGWEDKSMLNALLLPLLNEVLPHQSKDCNDIISQWKKLVGNYSLIDYDQLEKSQSQIRLEKTMSQHSNMKVDIIRSYTSPMKFNNMFNNKSVKGEEVMERVRQYQNSIRLKTKRTTDQESPSLTESKLEGRREFDFIQLSTIRSPSSSSRSQSLSSLKPPVIYTKSKIVLANRPFSLEAPSLDLPLLRLAKRTFGEQYLAKLHRQQNHYITEHLDITRIKSETNAKLGGRLNENQMFEKEGEEINQKGNKEVNSFV